MHDRLMNSISHLSNKTNSQAEVLDRFYIAERFGIWNQKLQRNSPERISPFYSAASFKGLGLGLQSRLHVELISKHLPRTLTVPINDDPSPSLYRPTFWNDLRLESGIFAAKVRRKLLSKFSKPKDLNSARETVIGNVLSAMPDDFIYGTADSWAGYGARRFLRLYEQEASRTRN